MTASFFLAFHAFKPVHVIMLENFFSVVVSVVCYHPILSWHDGALKWVFMGGDATHSVHALSIVLPSIQANF